MSAINPRELDAISTEYGVCLDPVQVRLLARLGSARPIDSAEAYVGAVRRLFPQETGFGILDGRLIAPLWRGPAVRPSEWWGGFTALEWARSGGKGPRPQSGRAWDWVAYQYATQERPDVVGSDYNDDPHHVARAWALGIPAERYPRGLGWYLPHREGHLRWRGNRHRIRAVLALSRKGAPLYGALRTADLRRLARLPGWLLRASGVPTLPVEGRGVRQVDWRELHGIARLVRPYRERLQDARIPAHAWLQVFEGSDIRVGGEWVDLSGSPEERVAAIERHTLLKTARRMARVMRELKKERSDLFYGPMWSYSSAWNWLRDQARERVIARLVADPQVRRAVARYNGGPDLPDLPEVYLGHRFEPEMVEAARRIDREIQDIRRERRELYAPADDAPDIETRLARWRFQRAERARQAALAAAVGRRDTDGGLVGVKAMRLDRRRGLLLSPQRHTPWERPYLVADHWDGRPKVRETCGIHAWWHAEQREDGYFCDVLAEVRGYGRYAEGPEGWRAEEVVIIGLEIRARHFACPEVIDQLTARYGVPVTVAKETF